MTNENKIMLLNARKQLLMTRDPVANRNIVRKIDRNIKKLEK